MNRPWLLGIASLLAFALPGVSSAQSGYVGVNYDTGTLHLFGSHADYDGWSGDGAAQFDLGGGWGTQVDLGYVDNSFSGSSSHLTDWDVDGHLYHRDANWQWGGGLAYSSVHGYGSSDINTWTGAGEGRWFLPNASLGASLSYSHVDASGSSAHSWRLGGDGRIFITDNFLVRGDLSYETLSASGSSIHAWNGGVGAEWQFSSLPISLTANYNRNDFSIPGSHAIVDAFTIGARWNFGGGTLHQRDQTGANLDRLSGPYDRLFTGS